MASRLGGTVVFAVIVSSVVSIAGCSHAGNDPGGKSDDPGGSLGPNQGAMPWAANAGEVARFADEEPFGPAAVVAQDKTRVRKSPGGGEIVATLPVGADVVKLAAHGSEDLVCFDEPKPGTRHLMGWIAQSALEDPAPATPPVPSAGPAADDGGTAPPDPPPPHGGGHHHRQHKGRHG